MADISTDTYIMRVTFCEEVAIARAALTAPSVIYRPALYPDGDQWCALYGDNLQEGVAGFGDTPADAMEAFDEAWKSQLARPTPKDTD